MEKYYVSGCKDNGSETVTCDDNEAQFWTLYVRDDAGLSQGVIDCVFREDAEAAMAVYVERDALLEQVRALAAEGAIMHTAIDQTIGWQQWVDAGNTESVRCLVAIQGKTPRIDAALREIRAQAVNGFSEFCGDNSVFIKETCNYDSLAGAACIYLAHIREGDQS